MPGLRLLLRFAPFAVGAVAAAVWLRRRGQRRALLEPAPVVPAIDAPAPPVADEDETGRFARASAPAGERRPIDIVTVVDDLLEAGR